MDVIDSFTRKETLADGVFIDVGRLMRDVGIRYPTAITAAVWNKHVLVPAGVTCQDQIGRLWEIVWRLFVAIHKAPPYFSEIRYQLYVHNNEQSAELVTLKAICSLG